MTPKASAKTIHPVAEVAIRAALKLNRLKATKPRLAILAALERKHGPFTAEEIHKLISRKVCDLATVYRTLSSLEEAELVARCEFGDGTARYELKHEAGGHHHHVVCNACKRVEVVDSAEIERIDRFAQNLGYSNVSHTLEFFGVCPRCR